VLTAATGGIALPMLALACVNLAVNVGDSVCAFRNLRNMQALARGEEPPYKLPGGTSCIKNLVHNLATAAGAGNETAGQVATVIGGFVQVGLAVGAFVSGQAAGALPLAHKIANIVSSGLKALMAGSTAVTTGFVEAGAPGVPGHTGEAMRRAVMSGQEALAMSPDIVGADAGQQRVLEIVRDQQGQPDGPRARAERLVVDAVKNYGDAKVNAAMAIAGFAGMGKALMGI
jgi:hypothetical protein